jgi:hypothetical protein
MQFNTLLALAILTIHHIAAAMPITNLTTSTKATLHNVCDNCMSCTAKQYGALILSYKIHVGAPFAAGGGCDPIFESLQDAMGMTVSTYHCRDDGMGKTKLTFTAMRGYAAELNAALNTAYPSVEETMGGFNCPGW